MEFYFDIHYRHFVLFLFKNNGKIDKTYNLNKRNIKIVFIKYHYNHRNQF